MNGLDWNDLRYLLATARTGSAAGAARTLGVSHATALRRVQGLEEAIGAPLFDRLMTGYAPTEVGRRFIEIGETFERTLTSTRRAVEGDSEDLAGSIRFTTSDSLGYSLMPGILATFRALHPEIAVEMRVTNTRLDLESREADVVLRPTHAPPPSWVGRRVLHLDAALYAAPSWLDVRGDASPAMDWLMPDGVLAQVPMSQWLRLRMRGGRIAATADSFLLLRRLAEHGLGATVLPRFVVDDRSCLVLLERLPRELALPLWLLTHPHLRNARRIRVFMEHVGQAMRQREARDEETAAEV